MTNKCGVNETHPIANYTGCGGSVAFQCLCVQSVVCCENQCDKCRQNQKDSTFTLSWPLVAGWYAMLVVLFCLGRRGRLMGRHCVTFRRWRSRDDEVTGDRNQRGDVEMTPGIKTRQVVEADLATDSPSCCICINRIVVGDIVAVLECQHLYHSTCILEWLRHKASCPLCAQHIDFEQRSSSSSSP